MAAADRRDRVMKPKDRAWGQRNRYKERNDAAEKALQRLRRVFKKLGAPPRRKPGEDKF
jgi:hypothetical protein